MVSISGDISEFLLKKVSNDLKDKIQSLPNVLEVQIGGEREEQLDIIMERIRAMEEGLIWKREAKFEITEALLRTLYQGRNK